MDRVHRIGQVRDVRVLRFVMADSLEERMLHLQESKALLGKGTQERLDAHEKRMARLTFLRDLFRVERTEVVWLHQ